MEILKVEHVTKRFARHTALDDVSLTIPKGSVYGLLGPNGAGKTTLIRIINRITAPDEGKVIFDGCEIQPQDVYRIGYLPEERGLYKKMKVGEQAVFFARLKGLSRHEAVVRLKKWFVKFGIESWWDRKVDELSKGMAQKVQFIATVVHNPKLLIFDEPFSGFDPVNTEQLKKEILRLNENGSTILFSTHNMSSVEEVCKEFTLINKSKAVLQGNVYDIRCRFKKNLFKVHVAEKVLAPDNDIYSITALSPQLQSGCEATVKLNSGVTTREAISALNDKYTLLGFEEILPSMNEIFIETVTDSANEQK